jgi:hypothetical protein
MDGLDKSFFVFGLAELRGPFKALTVILEWSALILLKETRQATLRYVIRSCNHCFSGKSVNVTYCMYL